MPPLVRTLSVPQSCLLGKERNLSWSHFRPQESHLPESEEGGFVLNCLYDVEGSTCVGKCTSYLFILHPNLEKGPQVAGRVLGSAHLDLSRSAGGE